METDRTTSSDAERADRVPALPDPWLRTTNDNTSNNTDNNITTIVIVKVRAVVVAIVTAIVLVTPILIVRAFSAPPQQERARAEHIVVLI